MRPAAIAAVLLAARTALALPAVGTRPPDVPLEDADGRVVRVAAAAPRPALVVYESRASNAQNWALKRDLSDLAESGAYRDRVLLLPVAHLEGLDYFPVSFFVRRTIRAESKEIDATIHCDWTGEFARAWGLDPQQSSVVLLGRAGTVVFAAAGPLSSAERRRLLDLLAAELAP